MKRVFAVLSASLCSISSLAMAEEAGPTRVAALRPEAAPSTAPVVVVVTPDPAPPPPTSMPRHEVTIGAGFRGSLLPTAGFDPFSQNDFLFQGSIAAGVTLFRSGPAAIALFGGIDVGARSGTARGQDASLTMYRFLGGAETRLYLHRRFYLDAKLAPVAHHLRGTLSDDANGGRPLVSRAWTWGLDVSGGAGVALAGDARSPVRLYLTLDIGYTFAGEASMTYVPEYDAQDPRRFGAVKLPTFKPSGMTSRLGLAVGF